MSVPYMPLYVSDFEADTMHLSLEEDGAYNRLLRLCWRTPGCSIPNDRIWIMRQMRVDDETYDRVVQPIIDEYFTVRKRVFQKRQKAERGKSQLKSQKYSENGKKGGRPTKPLKPHDKDESNGLANQKPNESILEPEPSKGIKERTPDGVPKKKQGTRLPENFSPRQSELDLGKSLGMTPSQITDHIERFENYWISKPGKDGVKLDWHRTLNNWLRKAKDWQEGGSGNGTNRNGGGDGQPPIIDQQGNIIDAPQPKSNRIGAGFHEGFRRAGSKTRN